jgi:periplasmic divalent cation tolerance protein
MSSEPVEVSITADDPEWLTEFTRSLISDRLCTSGNIQTAIRSLYWWDGQIVDRAEARVTLHTRRGLVTSIIERVKTEHRYLVPSVIATPILGGNPDYLAWIIAETIDIE